jgi:hypothetical protein
VTKLVVNFRKFANSPIKYALGETVSASLSAVDINEQTVSPDVHSVRHRISFQSCRSNAIIVKNGADTVIPY